MSGQFSVVTAEMQAAQGHVVTAKGDVQSTASSLNSEVHAQQAGWVGQGGGAFRALLDAWNEQLLRVTNALDEFESSLRGADQQAASADETEATSFNPGRLGLA